MKQVISKDVAVKCVTEIPYAPDVIKQMKAAGYKITTTRDDEDEV